MKELNELVDDMTSQKKKDLVEQLERKAMEFVEEIQNLERKNEKLEDENEILKEQIN